MIKKTGYSGALKPSFAYIREHAFSDDKFIQEVPVFLDDEKIERLWNAKKYPIVGIETRKNNLPDFDFGSKGRKTQPVVYDYCQQGLKFLVAKSRDKNGRPVFDLLATYTLRTPKGVSIGLYYLPDGDMKNICFLGRVCHHRGTNDHINTDGKVIDKNSLHVHKINQRYIEQCIRKYGKNPEELIAHLQSADAQTVPGYEKCTIRQMADVAEQQFNISDELVAVSDLQERNLLPQLIDAINDIEKGQEC